MAMNDLVLPPALANVELIDADPETEQAIAEADEAVSAGRTMFFGSTEELDAYLRGITADEDLPHSA